MCYVPYSAKILGKYMLCIDAVNLEIFARVLFFAKSVKRHICDVKIRNCVMIYLHQKTGVLFRRFARIS